MKHSFVHALLLLSWTIRLSHAWVSSLAAIQRNRDHNNNDHSIQLFSGKGRAAGYTWQEEAFEIEVTVKVPKDTRAKDLRFAAHPNSIDLRLVMADGGEKVLLDGRRHLRGRVSLDGTYWVMSDGVKKDEDLYLTLPYREVTVTIEKMIRTPKDDFDIVEYDWNGVYVDDEDEVTYRKYDVPEELDVKEYSASLGVDIDNLNMSMVDKTMFSSGLNQTSMDELTQAGVLAEVTQQADGAEFLVNRKTGEPEPLDSVLSTSNTAPSKTQEKKKQIPFLDTNSPWHNAIPVNETKDFVEKELRQQRESSSTSPSSTPSSETDEDVVQQKRYFTRAAFAKDAATKDSVSAASSGRKKTSRKKKDAAADPIDLLTVKKLKEILRSQGLKVSGNKKELQDRVRQQVNALLQGKPYDEQQLGES